MARWQPGFRPKVDFAGRPIPITAAQAQSEARGWRQTLATARQQVRDADAGHAALLAECRAAGLADVVAELEAAWREVPA